MSSLAECVYQTSMQPQGKINYRETKKNEGSIFLYVCVCVCVCVCTVQYVCVYQCVRVNISMYRTPGNSGKGHATRGGVYWRGMGDGKVCVCVCVSE